MKNAIVKKLKKYAKTPSFGFVNPEPHVVDKDFLENIIEFAKKKTMLISSMIFEIRPTNCFHHRLNLPLISMKGVAMLVIFAVGLIKIKVIAFFL